MSFIEYPLPIKSSLKTSRGLGINKLLEGQTQS